MANIFTAPVYNLKELNNIFIELTAQNCNQRCKNCYINFGASSGFCGSLYKTVKDFISIDKIREALEDTKNENLHCIYLTGAEPMTHPDFNLILRTCLKRCNVCICTNASYLNEKKIRFLKKVEQEDVAINSTGFRDNGENCNQIFFKLSLAHFDELESDKVKYRGNYRQVLFALKTLSRYNFSTVLSIQNFYKLDKVLLEENFNKIFKELEIYNTDLQITNSYPDFEEENFAKSSQKTDCMHGRILTDSGVYTCPFLANDYRGRMGSSFKNYSKNFMAETDFCATCSKNNNYIFTIG